MVQGNNHCLHFEEGDGVVGVHAFTDFDLYTNAAMRTTSSVSLEDLLLNGILGAVGEMGEIVEQVKKHRFQGHELN